MSRNAILTLLLCLALILTGCGKESIPSTTGPDQEDAAQTLPTTLPDGDPGDVTCLGSYTAHDTASDETVVATMGDAQLTNAQLRVYYWMEVAASRQAGLAGGPDFSQRLDTQLVPISSRLLSWQQYYLEAALNTWATHQGLVLMGQETGVPTEDAYQPNPEKQDEYLVQTGVPATKYLYGWNQSYVPNRLHQDYLDALPDTLTALAEELDFGSADAMAQAIAGASGADLFHYADLANRAYMYFTEMGYHFEPTTEEVEQWYQAHQAELPAGGEKTVSIRHILLTPDNADVAADGTISASEEDWSSCLARANDVVAQWQREIKKTRYAQKTLADVPESRFSELACQLSADEGSRRSGGLYTGLYPGQLVPELDSWCFDDARQHGDYEIIRSSCGYHIVLFSSATEGWYTAALDAMRIQYHQDLMTKASTLHPVKVTYESIRLPQVELSGHTLTLGDLLYPDVAHERFPDMPLYLQQDYPETSYGAYPIRTHGCGITTMAMVASYLTDDELTPPELCSRYGYYCGRQGTEQVLFDDTPAELGFQVIKRSHDWEEAAQAVRDGNVVVSLQWAGYWTRGGHYLAIIEETEDQKYVVRDSNLFNYKRIPAHVNDCHTRGSITAAGQGYWIFEKKVVTTPACIRCGAQEGAAVPNALLRTEYHCAKCRTAMDRRSDFLSSIAG